ncbi:hypothetical protein ABID47_004994 [Paenibacillus favisporus]|uniref:Uncharacterized protein n=1 Tax=Paenibacillus favisporus TaxID=221028 RepID=A0ABV2F9D2_9BACL
MLSVDNKRKNMTVSLFPWYYANSFAFGESNLHEKEIDRPLQRFTVYLL